MKTEKPIIVPPKPLEPIEPSYKNYPLGFRDARFISDYKGWRLSVERYENEMKQYEQIKLIKFIKAADIKLILKKYHIKKIT